MWEYAIQHPFLFCVCFCFFCSTLIMALLCYVATTKDC